MLKQKLGKFAILVTDKVRALKVQVQGLDLTKDTLYLIGWSCLEVDDPFVLGELCSLISLYLILTFLYPLDSNFPCETVECIFYAFSRIFVDRFHGVFLRTAIIYYSVILLSDRY